MADFRRGLIDVLVATTVIEVGIDVKDATVMVIENAERFGLAQLHQLRGRVGRGSAPSWCYLLSRSTTADARERLGALERTNDGFELAEIDLRLRGEGEVLGARQSGAGSFRLTSRRTSSLRTSFGSSWTTRRLATCTRAEGRPPPIPRWQRAQLNPVDALARSLR